MKETIIRHIFVGLTSLGFASICTAGVMEFPTVNSYEERAFQYGVKLTIPDFPASVDEIKAVEAETVQDFKDLGDKIAGMNVNDLTFENTFQALDCGIAIIYDKLYPIDIITNTNHDAAMRDAASEAVKNFNDAQIGFNYREDVYLNLKAYADTHPALSDEDQRLVDDVMLEYRRLGYELPIEERGAVEVLNKKLSALSTDFGDNIRESNDVLVFTAEELDGLSPTFLDSIRNADGNYEIQVNVTHHATNIMKSAKSEAVRQRVFDARNRRAMDKNVDILANMVKTRDQLAKSLGYANWADYRTENRMAGTGKTAQDFLEDLVVKLEPKFKSEMAELLELKKEETGNPDAVLNIWDVNYYQEKQNQQLYSLDTEALRRYFPWDKCLQGLFEVYETVFGIHIDEIENPTLWDPDVSLYVVSDAESEKPLGLFYLDPFPREGKFNHFAEFDIITPGMHSDGTYQRATVALICNFPPPGENEPSLLTFDQVETLFHEFGHCMHSILTEAKFSRFAGTAVPRDFVEAPSQVMEYWLENKEVLDLFAADWQDQSKKLPAEIIEKMVDSKRAQAGWFYRRQLSFGLIDMALHNVANADQVADNIVEITNDIAARISLPYPEGSALVASFGHLAGYDAGYYGYAWADVIAADLASQFKTAPDGYMDAELGARLRKEIFATGNSRDVNISVEDFLGRKPNNKAFIESLGLPAE